MMFDTERPPKTAGNTAGPIAQIDFTSNPAAMKPFMDWVRSGEAWEAFGEWYDMHSDRYEAHDA